MGTLARTLDQSLSLKERLQLKKSNKVLLLDYSGSMSSDCEPGISKIQALRDIVSKLSGIRIIAFNDIAWILDNINATPRGGTYMSKAILYAQSMNYKQAVMVTDGEDAFCDQNAALEAVKDFQLQILYVGPGPRPEFLDKLGSKCTTESLSRPQELEGKLRLLLEDGQERKNIQL